MRPPQTVIASAIGRLAPESYNDPISIELGDTIAVLSGPAGIKARISKLQIEMDSIPLSRASEKIANQWYYDSLQARVNELLAALPKQAPIITSAAPESDAK